jgi:hypothetical protein
VDPVPDFPENLVAPEIEPGTLATKRHRGGHRLVLAESYVGNAGPLLFMLQANT